MASFRTIIDTITGESDLAQVEREALNSLQALADQKADFFEQQLQLSLFAAGEGSIDRTVPVSIIARKLRQTRCYSSNDAGKITDEVEGAITKFIGGNTNDVVSGVFDLIGSALTVFLGASRSSTGSFYEYFVYATPFGIYRMDIYAWYQDVTATALKELVQKATAYSYTISVVDITRIAWRDFVALYGAQLLNEKLSAQQVATARDEIQLTWKYLMTDPVTQAAVTSSTEGGIPNPNGYGRVGSSSSVRAPLSASRNLVELDRIDRASSIRRTPRTSSPPDAPPQVEEPPSGKSEAQSS